MTGFYNSPILNRLVDISPRLKGITVDGGGPWLSTYEPAEAHWDGTELSNQVVSLISCFGAVDWSHLHELCQRPAFRPRDIKVYDAVWAHTEETQEEAWRLMALMPELETFAVGALSTERLAHGLLGSKSFSVT